MDFDLAAERLMAATTPNRNGSLGIDWMEWKERHMNHPDLDEDRKVIAAWLKGFYNEVVRDAQEKMAEAEWKKINEDLKRHGMGPV